mmetsp:Transcript_137033/g.382083  ORF Transcript_137033/g.382083 Transcript_137033/m.382083 type:complete len:111 (-) Transcript_137033:107-439(-)
MTRWSRSSLCCHGSWRQRRSGGDKSSEAPSSSGMKAMMPSMKPWWKPAQSAPMAWRSGTRQRLRPGGLSWHALAGKKEEVLREMQMEKSTEVSAALVARVRIGEGPCGNG